MTLKGRNLLKMMDFTPEEILYLVDLSAELKEKKHQGIMHDSLVGKNIALIFEKTSTRTRCSFEVAAHDLGMHVTYLDPSGSQIGKKESIPDTARVLGRMFDGIEYRGYGQEIVSWKGLRITEARRKKTNVRSGRTAGKTTVANTAESKMMRHRRRMSEAKAVRIVRKTIVARNASIVTAVTIAAKSANTATGMTTVRNESTGNAAITVAETTIVTAARMQTVKTVAGAEKNANTAESGISGGIETTTERIIRVETTNVENKNGVTIHSHERLDELHRNGYWIIQDPGRFCFGMDAVLLSGFAKVKPGERALDLGTGTGIIPILLEAKTKGEHFTGLEIQPESADMAARSVAYNHLEEKITIVTGDIREASARFGAGKLDDFHARESGIL